MFPLPQESYSSRFSGSGILRESLEAGMSKPVTSVGSFWIWLVFRFVSLAMCVLGLVFAITSIHPLNLQFFGFGSLWVAIGLVGFHDLIYGVADEEGIRYRQYFRRKFLGWEEIAVISWTNANIVHIQIKDRGRLRGNLSAQTQEYDFSAELYSAEPQLIRWLTLVKPPTADGIELRDPVTSMPTLLRWDPRVAVRIFLFFVAVICVILLFSTVHSLY